MKSQESTKLSRDYWTNRWQEGQTGWDVGSVSTPFLQFFDTLGDKDMRILIPGCGNGYEGEFLWRNGFTNVFILDISEFPLKNFQQRVTNFPSDHLLCLDFFELDMTFDLILEQTFFCAIHPELRRSYVQKMHALLKPNGLLAGLMFNFPLTEEGPPFGGSKEEYVQLFSDLFEIFEMKEAADSITPRLGRELWVEMRRK